MKSRNRSKVVRVSGPVLDHLEERYPDASGWSVDAMLRDLFGIDQHWSNSKTPFVKGKPRRSDEIDALSVGETLLIQKNNLGEARRYVKSNSHKTFEFHEAGVNHKYLRRTK